MIMYLETFKSDVIVFICIKRHTDRYFPESELGEIIGKMSNLSIIKVMNYRFFTIIILCNSMFSHVQYQLYSFI